MLRYFSSFIFEVYFFLIHKYWRLIFSSFILEVNFFLIHILEVILFLFHIGNYFFPSFILKVFFKMEVNFFLIHIGLFPHSYLSLTPTFLTPTLILPIKQILFPSYLLIVVILPYQFTVSFTLSFF
jgi:hypothetical protein